MSSSSSDATTSEEEEETDNSSSSSEEEDEGVTKGPSSEEEEEEEEEEVPVDLKEFVGILQQLNECMVSKLPIGDILKAFPDHDKARLKDEAVQAKEHLDSVIVLMAKAKQHIESVISELK